MVVVAAAAVVVAVVVVVVVVCMVVVAEVDRLILDLDLMLTTFHGDLGSMSARHPRGVPCPSWRLCLHVAC